MLIKRLKSSKDKMSPCLQFPLNTKLNPLKETAPANVNAQVKANLL